MPHKTRKSSVLLPAAVCAGLFFSLVQGVAVADPGKGHGHAHKHQGSGQSEKADNKVTIGISIGAEDRAVIQNYIRRDSQKNCPPGLAKKHNGCMPPGIAKKYNIGKRLPDDVVLSPLSDDILNLLHPAPKGYMYARVDKDVLLINEASKKVIDAVTLLSAVGN